MENINYALVPKTHTPIYLMHKYWARKPHNVVAQYIKHYSKKNEIVLDPFVGSGVTAIEAIRMGRKAIAIDLNPLSTFMTKNTLIPIDIEKLEKDFKQIEKDSREKINNLYTYKCPSCGKDDCLMLRSIWSYVVECPSCNKEITMFNAQHGKGKKQAIYACPFCQKEFNYATLPIKNEVLIEFDYECKSKYKKGTYKGNAEPTIEKFSNNYWFPNDKLYYPSGKPFVTKRRIDNIKDLFTKRNLHALSVLFHSINSLEDSPTKDLLLFTFTSTLGQVSRLVPYEKAGGGLGWIYKAKEGKVEVSLGDDLIKIDYSLDEKEVGEKK
jgi:endogenous inhibitor of DNA gyrase (YacG/DUF329 family)